MRSMRIYSLHNLGYHRSRTQLLAIALTSLGLLVPGCSKPLAIGKATEVAVLADGELLPQIEPDIRAAMEREILSVRRETAFHVSFAPLEDPGEFRKWSKVIVVGSLDGGGAIGDLLPEDVRGQVLEKRGLLYATEDLWARGQVVFVLAAASRGDLLGLVANSGETLFSRMSDLLREQVRARMFQSGRNDDLASSLRAEYGFAITLPRVYRRDLFSGIPRTVRFFNLNPQRSIFVYWEEAPRDSLVPGEVIETRKRLAERFYPGDRLLDGSLRVEKVDFHGHDALKVTGVWQNREELEGGTFTSYAFNCPESGRFYLIDGLLFSPDPKKSKYVYLIQIDTIVDSFQCAPPGKGD